MEWEIEDETPSEESDETSNSEEDPPSEESDEASDSDSTGSSPDSSRANPHIQSYAVMWDQKEDKQKESQSNITTKDEAPVLQAFLKTVCILFVFIIEAVVLFSQTLFINNQNTVLIYCHFKDK